MCFNLTQNFIDIQINLKHKYFALLILNQIYGFDVIILLNSIN